MFDTKHQFSSLLLFMTTDVWWQKWHQLLKISFLNFPQALLSIFNNGHLAHCKLNFMSLCRKFTAGVLMTRGENCFSPVFWGVEVNTTDTILLLRINQKNMEWFCSFEYSRLHYLFKNYLLWRFFFILTRWRLSERVLYIAKVTELSVGFMSSH